MRERIIDSEFNAFFITEFNAFLTIFHVGQNFPNGNHRNQCEAT